MDELRLKDPYHDRLVTKIKPPFHKKCSENIIFETLKNKECINIQKLKELFYYEGKLERNFIVKIITKATNIL